MRNIIVIIGVIASAFTFNKDYKEAYIYFGSGFKNDTISFFIDTSQVLKEEILTSDKEYNDITNVFLKIEKDSILLFRTGEIISRFYSDAISDGHLNIIIKINGLDYAYTMYLSKGKYLFVSKHNHYYNVYFNQFKKPVKLY